MPTATVDGHAIAWRAAGHGAPALLLHCGLAHSGAFSGLMRRLGERLAMRALDQPGHGGTGRDPTRRIQEQAVADARALLAGTPAHLVGHSFGGTVALRLAIESPELVTSLTLIEPVQYSLLEETGDPAFAAEMTAEAPMHAAVAADDWPRATALFLERWGTAGGLAAMAPAQAAYMLARMPLVVASEIDLSGPAVAVRHADLARIACPVLLIDGGATPPVVPAILAVIAAAVPQAGRLTVPGAGHMLPVTHPGPVADAIRRLVS